MDLTKTISAALILFASCATQSSARPNDGSVHGRVTLSGVPPKSKPFDISKEPDCVRMRGSNPIFPEDVVTGPDNSLRNVVVYITSGPPENAPAPSTPVAFDQQGCHYSTHVLAFRVGQEVRISNSDPLSHNIHPVARVNREWNKIQPAGTPPFSYAYEHEEFIPVRCNIHPWMHGYFAVLKTSHFAVTTDDGSFTLPDLPPGHYVVTAWHEVYGSQSKEFTVLPGQSASVDFSFSAKH